MITKGDLPLDIHWTLNGAPIVSGEHGITLFRMNPRTSSLNIDSLDAMHRGVFKCIARNKAGTDEFATELHVNGLCLKTSFCDVKFSFEGWRFL